jgi:hypothetical protein
MLNFYGYNYYGPPCYPPPSSGLQYPDPPLPPAAVFSANTVNGPSNAEAAISPPMDIETLDLEKHQQDGSPIMVGSRNENGQLTIIFGSELVKKYAKERDIPEERIKRFALVDGEESEKEEEGEKDMRRLSIQEGANGNQQHIVPVPIPFSPEDRRGSLRSEQPGSGLLPPQPISEKSQTIPIEPVYPSVPFPGTQNGGNQERQHFRADERYGGAGGARERMGGMDGYHHQQPQPQHPNENGNGWGNGRRGSGF